MKQIGWRWTLALVLLAQSGAATAQVTLRGAQPAASSATADAAKETPGLALSEPKSMAGMLAAQNEVRRRLNLAQLGWSNELTEKAEETVQRASEGACSRSLAERTGATDAASIYWAPGVRRLDGGGKAQEISPSFLVSEWRAGSADYDPVRGECRRTGHCEQYARMVAPTARAVGCSKTICANQAQIWACHYSGAGQPASTTLRPRQGD
jgi:hypothetical protein